MTSDAKRVTVAIGPTVPTVTLSLGVRMDWFYASIPGYHLSPSIITPLRNYDVPDYQSVRHKDLTPKMAAAWDVRGDGKTAVFISIPKWQGCCRLIPRKDRAARARYDGKYRLPAGGPPCPNRKRSS